MNSKTKVLLTGATSFLGTHIASSLLKEDAFQLRVVTHRPENIDNFKSVLPVHKVEWIIADLTNKEQTDTAV